MIFKYPQIFNHKKFLIVLMMFHSLIFLNCCAHSISRSALSVQVHKQMSNLLSGCIKLGPVSAVNGDAMGWHKRGRTSRAISTIRDKVYRMRGDSVVILSSEQIGLRDVHVQGIAFRCYKGRSDIDTLD